ncbi:Hypothetical protein CINCED_3A022921 [Cinara cedri]|uniref:Elongator complex protein 2 n=1 Tax=Cinara cedri TaxID=506608 RepID=A0A5E4MJY4_9HEMI|nr:Hypothetical protein CINCED_3A022921 [Cinara cedri]
MCKFENINNLVKTVYVSSAVNRTPHCLDWSSNGLVIYGSCNAIHLYDPQITNECDGQVISSFVAHTMRVNCVKWVQNTNNSCQKQDFVSCSTDNTAILWEDILPTGNYRTYEKLIGHSDVVTITDALRLTNEALYIVTAAGDCTVKVWIRHKNKDNTQCFQTINCDNILCLSLKISILPYSNSLLLACGLSNNKIQLYINDFSNINSEFVISHSLIGHEDWVRSLDFVFEENSGTLFLASGSQDSVIRLWKFTIEDNYNNSEIKKEFNNVLKLESKNLNIIKQDGSACSYVIQLETVISGHDGWIYGVHWKPNFCSGNQLELLSVSMDKTLAVWTYDENSGLWVDFIRLGEVGGNTLGFYGGKFSPDGNCILAQGYNGSFHLWKKHSDGIWAPGVTIGGHFGSVEDIAWDPEGKYIVSVSSDQTTRIHAQWLKSNELDKQVLPSNWHEMARPQVHGYNMSSVAMLSSLSFVSSAEEKVIRTFQAPSNFLENMIQLSKINFPSVDIMKYPLGASVPSLGLSNKAVSEEDCKSIAHQPKKKDYPEHYFVPLTLKQPPTEEDLVQNTLWPETQKLYGHVYEVYCLASSPNHKWLASAAKATSLELASIIIWDLNNFQLVQKLTSHNLTVTQLAFSPDSTKLLSVSRDRTWSLFSYNENKNSFIIISKSNKRTSIHTRIIWCCAWTHDSLYFATGSRDGKLVTWGQHNQSDNTEITYCAKTDPLVVPEKSFSAVAFASTTIENYSSIYLLAVGTDCGNIGLYKWNCEENHVTPWLKIVDLCNEYPFIKF